MTYGYDPSQGYGSKNAALVLAGLCSCCLGEIMKRQKGFSLIELLIVVAIILIIAAIAIPSYLRSRMAANESAAVASIRTINTAEISYNSAYPTVGFSSSLTALAGTSCTPPDSTSACLIDTQLAGGIKNGYTFSLSNVTGTPNATYSIIGGPVLVNGSGVRYFCSFQDAVVRVSMSSISTCDTSVTPLQ
jgi:type IV pilus assembly protein PilA